MKKEITENREGRGKKETAKAVRTRKIRSKPERTAAKREKLSDMLYGERSVK